jgi:hypothetical protein
VFQYWFFYPFDDWRDVGLHLRQVHEGDWEFALVGVSAAGPTPLFVAYSHHCFGGWTHLDEPGIHHTLQRRLDGRQRRENQQQPTCGGTVLSNGAISRSNRVRGRAARLDTEAVRQAFSDAPVVGTWRRTFPEKARAFRRCRSHAQRIMLAGRSENEAERPPSRAYG